MACAPPDFVFKAAAAPLVACLKNLRFRESDSSQPRPHPTAMELRHVLYLALCLALFVSAEAINCGKVNKTITEVREHTDGKIYTCEATVPRCRGGCASKIRFNEHVDDSAQAAKDKCSFVIGCCRMSGAHAVQAFHLSNCRTNTNAHPPNPPTTWNFEVPNLCTCDDDFSASDGETRRVKCSHLS